MKLHSTKGLGKKGVKVVLYGKSGSRKTRTCATAPTPIILSCEGGLLSIRDQDIPFLEIKNQDDIDLAYEFVMDNKKDYESVCLDSITDIAEKILTAELRENKDPRKAYGNMFLSIKDIIWTFKDIKKMNVVFTAKRGMIDEPESGMSQYVPLLPGNAMLTFLPYEFDEVFYLTTIKNDEGKNRNILLTRGGTEYEAKDRSGSLNLGC